MRFRFPQRWWRRYASWLSPGSSTRPGRSGRKLKNFRGEVGASSTRTRAASRPQAQSTMLLRVKLPAQPWTAATHLPGTRKKKTSAVSVTSTPHRGVHNQWTVVLLGGCNRMTPKVHPHKSVGSGARALCRQPRQTAVLAHTLERARPLAATRAMSARTAAAPTRPHARRAAAARGSYKGRAAVRTATMLRLLTPPTTPPYVLLPHSQAVAFLWSRCRRAQPGCAQSACATKA